MLLSMTGYGEGRFQNAHLSLSVELRALNNRYLKVTLRAPDPYHLLEAEFEKVVRKTVRRGAIQVHLRCEVLDASDELRLDITAIRSYLRQLEQAGQSLGMTVAPENVLGAVLQLPGVAPESVGKAGRLREDWPAIQTALETALGQLHEMRREEGKAMARELLAYRDAIGRHLGVIRERAPAVVATYRDRLLDRVRSLVKESEVEVNHESLIREVAIFAERSDIAEEMVRLATHLDHFEEIMREDESPGRKLEFLTQEMSREANTIGSKASDVTISREVVEIKGVLEKIRELIQNVE